MNKICSVFDDMTGLRQVGVVSTSLNASEYVTSAAGCFLLPSARLVQLLFGDRSLARTRVVLVHYNRKRADVAKR